MRHFRRLEKIDAEGYREHVYGNVFDVEKNIFAFNVRFIGWDKEHFFFASENYGHVYRVNRNTDEVSVCYWGYDFVKDTVTGNFEPWGKNAHDYTESMTEWFSANVA